MASSSPAALQLTYDDLEVPQDLDEHSRMVHYASSQLPLQRLVCASNLSKHTLEFALVASLASDAHPIVREALAGQVRELLKIHDSARVLDLCSKLAADESKSVRQACVTSLAQAHSPNAGPLCVSLAMSANPGVRETSVVLIASMGDSELASALVLSLLQDEHFAVRKAALTAVPGLMATTTLDPALATRLHAGLLDCCTDAAWPVRKAAMAAAAATHDKLARPGMQEAVRVAVQLRLKTDSVRWVRIAAYAALGPLLAVLKPGKDADVLLAALCDERELESDACWIFGEPGLMTRTRFIYNLPGVLQPAPEARWAGPVRAVFHQVVADPSLAVRQTLAGALGKLGQLLGPACAEKDLLPVLLVLLRDDDDEHGRVRVAAVESAAQMLPLLPPNKRAAVVEALSRLRRACMDATTPSRDVRLTLATQLRTLAELKLGGALVDEALVLGCDDVFVVRQQALAALGKVLALAQPMEQTQGLNLLVTWAGDVSYTCRLNFCEAASNCLAENKELFEKKLGPLLANLKQDKVQAVRAAAEKALAS